MPQSVSAFLDEPTEKSAAGFLDEQSASSFLDGKTDAEKAVDDLQLYAPGNEALRATIERQARLNKEPKHGLLSINKSIPFIGGTVLGEIPDALTAFGSEALKSSPAAAAGLVAASGVTPLANRIATPLAGIPVAGPFLAGTARIGIPLIAGGAAALGERALQDATLPQILPEDVARSYRESGSVAGENPVASMLGQFAGQGPFFRPGLPVGTTGLQKLTTPLITGGIGGGIEAAQQIREGEFDPTKLAIAAAGSALMNRETALGARLAPNFGLPRIGATVPPAELAAIAQIHAQDAMAPTGVSPAELAAISQIHNEPRLPAPTDVPPAELSAISQFRDTNAAEGMVGAQAGEAKLRALAERMAGKSPEQQKAIVDQETKLQADTLTSDEQRAALDLKQGLEDQIAAQKQAEKAAADQQRAQEQAAKAQQEALSQLNQPPEIPKSAQILAEGNKPEAIANTATQVGTQTENSPFALQAEINKMVLPAEAPTPKPPPATEYAGFQEGADPGNGFHLYTLNEDIPGHPSGSTVSRETLAQEGFDVSKLPEAKGPSAREQLDQQRAEEKSHAIQEQIPDESVLREPATQPRNELELPAVGEGNAGPEAPARDQALGQALQEPALTPRQRAVAIRQQFAGVSPNPLLGEAGRVNPTILAPLGGATAGAAFGATQGDTPEERVRNALLYGSLGLGLGASGHAIASKLFKPPVRQYQSPILKRVDQMLTPKPADKKGLFDLAVSAANDFRYRFNTRFAPLGHAQRELFKLNGREFTPGAYHDVERSMERLAGAPVQAEAQVERLQWIIDKLPEKDVPHLDTYLTLARIEDRLVKTGEENAGLSDAVGRAQAEYDAAEAAYQTNKNIRTHASRDARLSELNSAVTKMNENFNRKRVGDWSIADARKGLADLEAQVGPQDFAKIQQAGQEFQQLMRDTLDIQVKTGRMSSDLRDRIVASNDFYAPFKVLKYFEENEPFTRGGGTQRIPSSEQLAKKITGIDDNDVRIGSPTAVAAEQVYKGYILAQKNRKLREFATLARLDPAGEFVRPLAAGQEPRTGYDAVTYFQGGEPQRLEVNRDIGNALNGLNASETDLILKGLGKFANVFKLGATGLNIPFNIANAFIHDPARLATISKYGFRGPQDFAYTLYEWPKALISSLQGNVGQALGMKPDALYEQWIRSGAAGSTLARVMTPEAFASKLPNNAPGSEVVGDFNFLRTPIKAAALVSNTLEETTKLLGLQRAMRIERLDKLSPADRARKWAEIVTEIRNYAGSPDFSRAGVSMKPLNILLPFLNARWQGFTNDFARVNPFRHGNAKDAAVSWARLGTLVGLPAVALALYNRSTPENEKDYNQIPQRERDQYFHMPLNADAKGEPTILDTGKGYYFKNKDGTMVRGYYRIPKREFPGLMANTIDDFVGYLKSNDEGAFSQVAANFADNFAQTASPIGIQGKNVEERALSAASGLNPALRVPVEVALNKNLFTGRDIVPEGRQKASPPLQYSEQTPQGYRDAGAALPDFLPASLRSPAKLQHITEGMTGGFSRQFASPQLSPGNPAGESSPLLGRFYRSEHVESGPLQDKAAAAETERADQRIGQQEMASKLADVIMAKPQDQRGPALNVLLQSGKLDKDTVGYLREDLTDASRGLTYEDRLVKRSFAIAGGFRAKYYREKLSELQPAERIAYLQDQQAKGLLTKEVAVQLVAKK